MAQKDKVKELVGKGLNSYHTKALQQMDRIEKQSKEVNHKISILSNELDNDYLTKTEEGSVISLDHSKEGMVYIDSLEGNTLVNYCTDSSREFTLNGDIDTEGVNVTLTEGVDNGKVDVMCEGNTLVNLCEYKTLSFTKSDEQVDRYCFNQMLLPLAKRNTTYTLFANVTKNPNTVDGKTVFLFVKDGALGSVEYPINNTTGRICILMKTLDIEFSNGVVFRFANSNGGSSGEYECTDLVLLEGDWTDKEIPSEYFEGMKSVGQDDENGHKIEVLSHNKNLFRKDLIQTGNISSGSSDYGNEIGHPAYYKRTDFIKIKPNTNYNVSMNDDVFRLEKKMLYDINKKAIGMVGDLFNSGNAHYLRVVFRTVSTDIIQTDETLYSHNIVIEEGSQKTNYTEGKLNKKEILLNEPLRKLPNGVVDRFVKIGGKSYIERNCGEKTINGTESDWYNPHTENGIDVFRGGKLSNAKIGGNIICDKLKYIQRIVWNQGMNCNWVIGTSDQYSVNQISIGVESTQFNGSTNDFKTWLTQNPITVVYELASPIYEPLEVEPVLNTYNDITHISNNSVIPCNMKVKNTGYNAIIKPSTLYTVALDTNKSGTIGMNLGGAKVTTTNNVAKITTPATLADDNLRFYGKGIKGSKVRLLEGDKTNWIPTHFEGMKSSFEDKVQEDGTYKMEILSNNENLLDLTQHSTGTPYTKQYVIKDNTITGTQVGEIYTDFQLWFKLKRNKSYKLSWDKSSTYSLNSSNNQILKGRLSGYKGDCVIKNYNANTGVITDLPFDGWYTLHFHSLKNNNCIKNLQLKEINNSIEFVENTYNKIQFLLNEPLRSINEVKDRFVFINNKLMIERKCKCKSATEFGFNNLEDKERCMKFGVHDNSIKHRGGVNTYVKSNTLATTLLETEQPCIICYGHANTVELRMSIDKKELDSYDLNGLNKWLSKNPTYIVYELAEPTYEEVTNEYGEPIIMEGYENGTLYIDSAIVPTTTVKYTSNVQALQTLNEVKDNNIMLTSDINKTIIPYLMEVDMMIMEKEMSAIDTLNINKTRIGEKDMTSMQKRTQEMLERLFKGKTLTKEECLTRITIYLNAGKITDEQAEELTLLIEEIYA